MVTPPSGVALGAHREHRCRRGLTRRRTTTIGRCLQVERDDVHGASAHAPAVLLGEDDPYVQRFHPVAGRIDGSRVASADVGMSVSYTHLVRVQGAAEGTRFGLLPV